MMTCWLKQIEQEHFENKIFQIWIFKTRVIYYYYNVFKYDRNLETVSIVETYNWDKKKKKDLFPGIICSKKKKKIYRKKNLANS